MKKAYKVVTRRRGSCIIQRGPYRLVYKKGSTVEAVKGSIGIMCFKTRVRAEMWKHRNPSWKILEVEGYKQRYFKWMLSSAADFFSDLPEYYKSHRRHPGWCTYLVKDTILFDKVKVLT